jgi:hypothetical protein
VGRECGRRGRWWGWRGLRSLLNNEHHALARMGQQISDKFEVSINFFTFNWIESAEVDEDEAD